MSASAARKDEVPHQGGLSASELLLYSLQGREAAIARRSGGINQWLLAAKRNAITYAVSDLPRGGAVRITTHDPDALAAVHQFLAFQRCDHHAQSRSSSLSTLPDGNRSERG